MITNFFKNNNLKIIFIIISTIILDNLLILQIDTPPAWDQGFHLTNVFSMYNIIETKNINIFDKFDQLLNITDNYRGPLSYFLSALFLKIFGHSYHNAFLSNQIFNIICIITIFNLGKLFKNANVGIWGSLIFAFSSLIINQRTDYLIDLSLTSFSILNLFLFTKWFLDEKKNSIYSFLSGISLGLVFLTKPTGIIFFCFPFILIIIKLLKPKSFRISNFNQLIFFTLSFIILIIPWFSRHWLTIITSTINAWNWGINYQEGLESNSLGSWLYYFKKIPLIFGIINFSIFSIIFIFELFSKKSYLKINKISKLNVWFLFYLINCYLIISLMSTKDIRFVLPIYPILCIYLSAFLNSEKHKIIRNKKSILLISLFISIFLNKNDILFRFNKYSESYKWPHSEIIREISNKNSNLTSVLAILPDTKEINTFNLAAEASKQGEYVSVRQIISNEKTYKDDLKFFDWFLLKTKDQGIMTNASKNLLNKYLLNNQSFLIHKEWILPDDSKVILLKRKLLNTNLVKTNCQNIKNDLSIKQINNGFNVNISGNGKLLKSSNILIDFEGEGFKDSKNISVANGFFHRNFEENSCYTLSQNIGFNFPTRNEENLFLKARILDNNGNIKNLKLTNNNLILKDEMIKKNNIHMINRISEVKKLGKFLRNGEYKNLFNLVGTLNQSDPKQTYLADSEKIYTTIYKEKNNIDDLYSVLISQILQRKVIDAEKTINLILQTDNKNGNAHLVKSIINVYLLKQKDAKISLVNSELFERSLESNEISKTVKALSYFLEMKFISAFRILT